MAERQLGASETMILAGLAGRELAMTYNALTHSASGVDLTAIDRSMVEVRTLAQTTTDPTDPTWFDAVADVSRAVELHQHEVMRGTPKGIRLARMGVAVPNPIFKVITAPLPEDAKTEPTKEYPSGERKYSFLEGGNLLRIIDPQNAAKYRGKRPHLSVVMSFSAFPEATHLHFDFQRGLNRANYHDW